MSTHVEPGPRMPLVGSAVLAALAENWWLLLLRGLVSIAFGLIAFFWPDITLVALTYLFGIYAILDGVVAIWAAFNAPLGGAGPRWWLGLSGVVSILAGIAAFAYTGMTMQVLLVIIALWAIIIGLVLIWGAIELRRILDDAWLLGLTGALSIAFGVILIAKPGAGAVALVWTIGWFAIVFGSLYIALAFRLRKFKRT
jgi:uncharacterized membrane protein HdeD (DUF308 family)